MAIKYKDFEKREQLRKDYIDKAAEAAKTQANAYTDEQIRNIPAPPAPDIPTALPQKYEAFKVQLVQDDITWEEYHKPLWNGNIVLTTGTWDNSFVTDTIIDYPEVRKYSLLLTVGGVEKELKYVSSSTEYNTYACTENGTVVLNAAVQKMNVRNNYYNNTTTVYVYCPTGSALIGQSLTAAHYGKKQYVYTLSVPDAILQYPSETENARFLTMCKSIATKNAKIKLTITDNVIEANYINISNELVTTDENLNGVSYRVIGIVADRKALAVGNSYEDDMPTCIKGVLEVEYTDEEATKECVYDKIQGESYTFKIGDFNHEESSAFDYYFNGAILIPFSNAQIQASFTYRPVSGTEKSIQVKSMVNNGQMLPYFDISELFGQAANTVMAIITSNTAVENVDMGGRPITTISLTSNIQNFTDANDEIMVGSILTLTPESLPQKYYRLNTALSKGRWKTSETFDWINGQEADTITTYIAAWRLPKASIGAEYSVKLSDGTTQLFTVTGQNQQFSISINASTTPTGAQTAITVRLEVNADGSARILCSGANKEYHYIYTTIIVNNTSFYELENSAIKVNSEARYILDEKSYAIAKSAGLRKLIDKTEGKLRFTAELPPTSSIGSYLVVGETSAEGLAYIDDVLYSIPTNFPQTYKKKAVTLATSGWRNNQTIITATNASGDDVYTKYKDPVTYPSADLRSSLSAANSIQINMTTQSFVGEQLVNNSGKNPLTEITETYKRVIFNKGALSSINADFYSNCVRIGSSDSSFQWFLSLQWKSDEAIKYLNTITDADVKVNSEVRLVLDEANGKIAGQFGLKKTIDKEAGKLTFTADTLPTSAISGTLEIGETSTEGAAFVEGIIEPSSVPATVAKTDVENTFTKTQTFNGTESQAGIKTNAIDNENGDRVVYFNGTKQMFGSGTIPTQVRSSAQRLYFERPVSGGTGTEVVEIANLADAVSGSITKLVELTWSTYDDEISFRFSDTSKNYALNDGNGIPFATAESTNSRLRLDIGKTYAIVYNGTTYTAVAQKNVLGTHTSSKLEFTIGDKTLVLMDMATVSSNVSADNLPKYKNKTAIAYFSDYSTPTQGTSFVLKTIPWAYTTVIPYDDNFTQTADITISAALRNLTEVDPLYIAPTVRLSSDGINIWVPVFNTVQYGLDPLTSQPQITAFETKICPKKLLLILNSPTGSVVRLNGFSNRYRVGEGYGINLTTSSWSQSGTKYVGRVSGLFTNRFTDLEIIFESNEDSDRYYSANVRVKKSADWLTGTLTSGVTEFIADSMPEGQIRAHAYPIISY